MAIDQSKLRPTRNPGVFRMADGRLLAKVSVRVGDKVIVRKQVMPLGASEAEAVQATLDLREQARKPPQDATPTPHPPTTTQTFEAYCANWLAIRAKSVTPSTKDTYEDALHNFIVPRLGHLACKDVTRQALESWLVWAQNLPRKSARKPAKPGAPPKPAKPYAQETMRQWWRTLKTIIGDMTADLDLPDPTRRLKPPQRPDLQPVREQHTLDAKAVGDMLAACKDKYPTRLAEVATMALTGARAGEVYALKWDAVDFSKMQITIRRALSRGVLLERTKTKTQRVVPMHPDLADILLAHRNYQISNQVPGLALGMLFLSDDGQMRDPNSAKKLWPRLAKLANIDQKISPQVLRRTLNTMMLQAQVDRITLRAIMGHTSEAMTQRYAGIGDAAKTEAISRIRPTLALVPDP